MIQNNNTPSYYAIIPANIRYDNDLMPNAKLLYGEITALCNSKAYCWATNEYFAKLYNTSEKTITRWIKKLSDKGYVKTKVKTFRYNDGTVKNIRYIFVDKNVFDHIDNFIPDHIDKNVPYNYTYNNNTRNNSSNYNAKINNNSYKEKEINKEKEVDPFAEYYE